MGKTCLLVIDVQQGLVDEGPHEAAPFLAELESLLAAARKAGVPVAHVQHEEDDAGGLVPGTPPWKLVFPAAAGEPVFGKRFNSAFKGTGLDAWLKSQNIGSLVVCGMQTEYCLDASIKSAFEKGFRLTVPRGAHTTYDGRGMTATQIKAWYADQIWDRRFASVQPLEAVLAQLKGG